MLEESNKLLAQIKEQAKIRQIKKAKRTYLFNKYKKITFYLFITIAVVLILFFPIQTGEVIGNWINNFFGTIYKNSIK